MSKLRARKPGASMIVALIALFVAMGGTSYAAVTLGKNTVGSKQLKKNAVTTSKIKNGAVTGSKIKKNAVTDSKIKNGTITGNKIKLSSLGTVPSANSANSANSLAGLKRWKATVATPGSSSSPNSVTLASVPPFTVLGECYTDGTYDYAYTAIESSQSGDFAQGYSANNYNPTYQPLTPNTPEQISDDQAYNYSGGYYQFEGPDDGDWAATTPDQSVALNGFGNQGVLLQGNSGPTCSFSGFLVTGGS